ncbi:MAG: RNase A-like domain-containing protein [Terriglobia bacterium]
MVICRKLAVTLGKKGFVLSLLLIMSGCAASTTRESQESNPVPHNSRGASRARYDLEADEQRGGHTVRKHVGRTDSELVKRLDQEHEISAASTWTDLETAEETVAEALNEGHSKIERWNERGDRRPNLALHYNAGRVIGRSLVRGASQSESCTDAVVVLKPAGNGFFVLTTYPEVK